MITRLVEIVITGEAYRLSLGTAVWRVKELVIAGSLMNIESDLPSFVGTAIASTSRLLSPELKTLVMTLGGAVPMILNVTRCVAGAMPTLSEFGI